MYKRYIPAVVIALGLVAGCSTPSVITMKDGREIQTVDTPDFDKKSNFYEYEQIDGSRVTINADEVESIKPL